MPNTIIDLKKLKRELLENPPVKKQPEPLQPIRRYLRTENAKPTPAPVPTKTVLTPKTKNNSDQEKTLKNSDFLKAKIESKDLSLITGPKKEVKKPDKEKEEEESILKNVEVSRTPLLLSWSAPEYKQPSNSYERMVLAGIVAAGFFAGSLIISNYLLSLIVILTYIILYIYSIRRPSMVNFGISNRGLTINNRLYEFEDLKSFWIFYDPPYQKELSLESKKMIMPFIKIPLGDTRPAELRRVLVQFLPEKKHEDSISDIIARRLGY